MNVIMPSVRLVNMLLEIKMKYRDCFEFQSTKLQYFFHSYNNFGITPRCVEIPIIKYYLSKFPHDNVLEIGNVTKHYYNDFKNFIKKDTLDKYESAYDVINVDIKDFKTDKKYDFIYSISTFEHMDSDGGHNPDYIPIENEKFSSYAFTHINKSVNDLLVDSGKFILTFPIGLDNCEIDNGIYNKEYTKFQARSIKIYFIKKINELSWKQVSLSVDQLAKEKPKIPHATYLCVMEITK